MTLSTLGMIIDDVLSILQGWQLMTLYAEAMTTRWRSIPKEWQMMALYTMTHYGTLWQPMLPYTERMTTAWWCPILKRWQPIMFYKLQWGWQPMTLHAVGVTTDDALYWGDDNTMTLYTEGVTNDWHSILKGWQTMSPYTERMTTAWWLRRWQPMTLHAVGETTDDTLYWWDDKWGRSILRVYLGQRVP